MRRLAICQFLLAACARPPESVADPQFLDQLAATYRFSLGDPSAFALSSRAAFFLRSPPRSFVRDLYAVDLATGAERRIVSAEQLLLGGAEQLSAEERARRERMRLAARGIASFELSKDGARLLVPLSGRLFVVETASGTITELPGGPGYPIDARFSPDATRVSCVRDGDLYVTDVARRAERRLTSRRGSAIENGVAEFVAQEEMSRSEGYWWSPDGHFIAYQETDTTGVEVMHLLDPMHPESAPEAWPYPRPGKDNASVRLGVIPASGGPTVWVSWDRGRYPYLARVVWEKNAPLTLLVQNREQSEEALLAVDQQSGAARTLLIEGDSAWLNLDPSMPRWLADGSGFLWSSERGGHWQLELRSSAGELLEALTAPELGYEELLALHGDLAYVAARGAQGERHLYSVALADGVTQQLTSEPGIHGARFSDESPARVQTFAGPDGTKRFELFAADGRRVGAIASLAEKPGFALNAEWTTAGANQLRAVVIRPRNFEKGRSYPVLDYVYGGPLHNQVAPAAQPYFIAQWIADHGFIVVSIDGRGTPGRGRDWERAIRGNFADVPLDDQVTGLRALAERYEELDLSRVGIFGWSFGGYLSAMAVEKRPEIFAAGVAGAPVSEWRDYDTHYTERYLGLPEAHPDWYEQSSALTLAGELRRPLLIIHGTADDNVYFMHSIKLSDALFRAGKRHEMLPLAGLTHMVPDPLVTRRLYSRIVEFFSGHLIDGR